jgi:rhodanese-related sulfurtransferase
MHLAALWTTLSQCLAGAPADDAERASRVAEMYAGYRGSWSAAEVPEIDAAALARRLAAGESLVIVDDRTPAERAVSMVPGAVPFEEVEAHPERFRGKPLVAYCTIGYRSGQWTAKERALGLDVTNLAGGVLAWTHAGGALVSAEGPTKRVHVYGATWDLARTDYVATW